MRAFDGSGNLVSTGKSASPAASASAAGSLKRDRITTIALVILCQGIPVLTFGGIALFLPLIRADLQTWRKLIRDTKISVDSLP